MQVIFGCLKVFKLIAINYQIITLAAIEIRLGRFVRSFKNSRPSLKEEQCSLALAVAMPQNLAKSTLHMY